MKPVTGPKKYYGVTSKKNRLGIIEESSLAPWNESSPFFHIQHSSVISRIF
jgi:hypothetical protein